MQHNTAVTRTVTLLVAILLMVPPVLGEAAGHEPCHSGPCCCSGMNAMPVENVPTLSSTMGCCGSGERTPCRMKAAPESRSPVFVVSSTRPEASRAPIVVLLADTATAVHQAHSQSQWRLDGPARNKTAPVPIYLRTLTLLI